MRKWEQVKYNPTISTYTFEPIRSSILIRSRTTTEYSQRANERVSEWERVWAIKMIERFVFFFLWRFVVHLPFMKKENENNRQRHKNNVKNQRNLKWIGIRFERKQVQLFLAILATKCDKKNLFNFSWKRNRKHETNPWNDFNSSKRSKNMKWD